MSKERRSFSSGVGEELGHYVYRLIDPRDGQTFYVGRGQGDRVFAHANADLMFDGDDRPTDKLEVINEIRLAGLEPTHVVHRHGMADKTASEVEAALIDIIPGLTNLTTGKGSTRWGPATVGQLEERYAPPVMDPDPHHRLIFIKTKKKTVMAKGSLYEAVRCCWAVNPDRANRTDYVLAIVEGVCVAAFENCVWKQVADGGKSGFVGRRVLTGDIVDRYVRKVLPPEYTKEGTQASVMYCPKPYAAWKP